MRQRHLFHKFLSVTICALYLSLSLFSISCAYHCAFKDELPPSLQHSEAHHSAAHSGHDHHQNSSDNQHDEPDHGRILFCKFVHKAGNSAITASRTVVASFGFSLREAPLYIVVASQHIDSIYLSRAPPSVLS